MLKFSVSMLFPEKSLLLVGNVSEAHIGHHYNVAARDLGVSATLVDSRKADSNIALVNKLTWRLLNKRPARLGDFQKEILAECFRNRVDLVIFLGLRLVNRAGLKDLRARGFQTAIFLSDDPWTPFHRAGWNLEALKYFDWIFSPRSQLVGEWSIPGCVPVQQLPFAYCPAVHFPESLSPAERPIYESDVMFFGGADADRVPYVEALLKAGLKVRLHGGYWDRYSSTRSSWAGSASLREIRKAVAGTKVCLNLVRRANRDGHVMRTFEVPAMKGCMLTERTADHESFFGAQGVPYFDSVESLVAQTKKLVSDEALRLRYAQSAHQIVTARHSYSDRLTHLLKTIFL